MATNLNITNIPAPRVPFIDERTGLMAREWYRFFLNLFVLTGSGTNPTTLDELQIGPLSEDQSGDFLATLDTAQLMSMMAQFENAEAAIQGAYLQPVVQTGTIANYNLDSSPTAGGVVYGTGPALAVSAAGTLGQVLISGGAGAPTWAASSGGTVTSVSVVSANGLAGTVATATTTPAITLSTTITGLLKGNGTAISAAASGTDYAPATSGTSILYGNGSGGFSNVTIGTGVAFAGGTLSATGSGGTVTSVSWTGGIVSVATATTTPAFTIAGTSGGIPYFSSGTTWASSAALAAGSLVLGGGAGVTPATTTTGTGVVTALGVNTGTAGAFVVNGGALGAPSSGTVTNLTGTASININGTVGATTATTGAFTTVTSSNTTDSSSITTGAVTTAGGLGVAKKIYIGDNMVVATAARGVNFTANTAAAGMTSQLLNWYEEGTWTPTLTPGTGSITLSTAAGTYVRIGSLVTLTGQVVVGSVSSPANNIRLMGFPFVTGSTAGFYSTGSINLYSTNAFTGTPSFQVSIGGGTAAYVFYTDVTGTLQATDAIWKAGSTMIFSITYRTA